MSALFAALRPHQRKALQPYPYAVVPEHWTDEFDDALRQMEPHCFNARRNDGTASFVVRAWSGRKAIYVKQDALAFQLMAMAPGDGAVWLRNPNLADEVRHG